MSASRSGNLISINIHDFLLNKDDFMSLLYIEEDETDEAPPKRFIRQALIQDFVREGGWLAPTFWGSSRGVWGHAPPENV